MFDFISKLFPKRQPSSPAATSSPEQIQKLQAQDDKKKEVEQHRAATSRKIDSAKQDEAAVVELLLQCDFADGRFQAAQYVVSQAQVTRVRDAMKNLDKRVAKLMQMRLDSFSEIEAKLAAAEKSLLQIEYYLAQEFITSNQIVELDKSLAALGDLPDELRGRLQEKRESLGARIEEQTSLQRSLLDLVAKIDAVVDYADNAIESQIQEWQLVLDQALAHRFAASLPKSLVAESAAKLSGLRTSWQRAQVVVSNSTSSGVESVVRTDVVVNSEQAISQVVVHPQKVSLAIDLAQIETALQGLQTALEQGSIQLARKFERELRDVDVKQRYSNINLPEALKESLTVARKEFAHLQSWAKWSSDASREELVTTAEGLAALKLSPKEIVDTVTALRNQWKQMESTSGGAQKELWSRFDTACNKAYAPAAEFFGEQAEQRKANLIEVQTQLDALRAEAQALLSEVPDWKAIRLTVGKVQQLSKKLVSLDRKARVQIDAEITALEKSLSAPLEHRQQEEIAARKQLITNVKALDSTQKSTVDQLRAIQQQWQVQATAIPLSRKDEQGLWEEFRAACDAVFAQRREAAESADKQRLDNLVAKQAICDELEQFVANSSKAIEACIEKNRGVWDTIGHVPREQEKQIAQRFESAVSRLRDQISNLKKQQLEQAKILFLQKLEICQHIDAMISDGAFDANRLADLLKQAEQLPITAPKLNTLLNGRLQAASMAGQDGGSAYQARLQDNVTTFDGLLLELEILMSLDSPSDYAQDRLQKQVKLLQASLKSGNQQQELRSKLSALLELPVALSSERGTRLSTLLRHVDLRDLS